MKMSTRIKKEHRKQELELCQSLLNSKFYDTKLHMSIGRKEGRKEISKSFPSFCWKQKKFSSESIGSAFRRYHLICYSKITINFSKKMLD